MRFHGNEVKTRVRNGKNIYLLQASQPSLFFFFNFFYSKDDLKGQFIALSDDIE